MKAIRFLQGKPQLMDVPEPERDGEALVRVTTAGICNTDLEIIRGYANFEGTLGHEFVGQVVSSPVAGQVGRRVVGEINAGCATCHDCLAGDSRHCRQRSVLGIVGRDGAFAEFLRLPPANLLVVPDAVSDRQAVFTEPLAAACEILDQIEIVPGDRVAVIGDGKLGQLIARVLRTTGCDLVLAGRHDSKLRLARSAGIESVVTDKLTPYWRTFDFVIEASGSASGLQTALELVRPRGTVVLKSTIKDDVTLNTARIVVDEVTIVGSRCGRFEPALRLLESGEVDVEPLIDAEFALSLGLEALEFAKRPGVLKVLLQVS